MPAVPGSGGLGVQSQPGYRATTKQEEKKEKEEENKDEVEEDGDNHNDDEDDNQTWGIRKACVHFSYV